MLNTIDLFAGCGGLTEGFKLSKKFRMLAGVEWDKSAVSTLRHRLSHKWEYPNSDKIMLHFDIQRITELIYGFDSDPEYGSSSGLNNIVCNNKVNAVIGGPPCQAYSVAGRIRDNNGMHDDYRNFLFESYIKVVEHFQPDSCIFENVPGMLSAKPGGISIVDRVTKAFDEAGYYISRNLKQDAIFDTSDFGVPQKRIRIIILALKKDKFQKPENKVADFYSLMNSYKRQDKVTLEEALSGLPKIYPLKNTVGKKSHKIKGGDSLVFSSHEPRFHNKRDIDIFRFLAEDIESGRYEYTHSDALKRLYTERTGKISSVHKYHVLRKDKPSNTIPAHLYKDGLRHIHPDSKQARSITVREAARLQSFADDFEFLGANGANYKMIGNAVPPQFSKHIAIALNVILQNKKVINQNYLFQNDAG
jgi:DNA (cytosine-5)-methyltransferase 1